MRRAALLIAVALGGCAPDLPEHPGADEVLSALDKPWVGVSGVEELLEQDGDMEADVLAGICSASPRWLEVADRLYDTGNVHFGEELSSALAVALTKDPEAVLSKFDQMCHEPENLPESCSVPAWRAAAVEALRKVGEPTLAAARQKCVADLGPSKQPFGNGFCMRLVEPKEKFLDPPGSFGPLHETITLGCLTYTDFESRNGEPRGSVVDENGDTYVVAPGTWMGEKMGRIVDITAHRITIEQIEADENGDAVQHNVYMFRARESL